MTLNSAEWSCDIYLCSAVDNGGSHDRSRFSALFIDSDLVPISVELLAQSYMPYHHFSSRVLSSTNESRRSIIQR